MNRVGRERIKFASGASAMGGLFGALMVALLCAGCSQPELDDRHPGVKAPAINGKLWRPQRPLYDLDEILKQRPVLGLGNFRFTSVFQREFVRFDRKQNLHLWPVVIIGCERSPPHRTSTYCLSS